MITSSLVSSRGFYCLSQGISQGMRLLTWGGWIIFNFAIVQAHFVFVNWILLWFSSCYIVLTCYVYYYSIWFFSGFLLFSPYRDQSRDVTPRLEICVILQCTLFPVHPSSFRLKLLRLCNNSCAEALVVKLKFSIESPLLRLLCLNS